MDVPITTHILNTSAGQPAAGVKVSLTCDGIPGIVATGETNSDGRVENWSQGFDLKLGNYTLSFAVDDYFASRNESSFYSTIQISFKVASTAEHYHVPLLLNPFGYSTYRGS
jgi:5-hydroxyisourate hydrolase